MCEHEHQHQHHISYLHLPILKFQKLERGVIIGMKIRLCSELFIEKYG